MNAIAISKNTRFRRCALVAGAVLLTLPCLSGSHDAASQKPAAPQTPRNHNDLTRALRIAESLAVEQTVLTHAGHRLDAWLMEHPDALPAGVRMGHDGDVFELG